MEIALVDTADRRQVRDFLDLPFRLYRDVPQWVPPLARDSRLMLDRRHHPFYRHSAAAFFLASEGPQVVGRLAVLDNANYNTFNDERTAFFYLFECVDEAAIAQALFAAGMSWARDRGLNKMIGPKGFTAFDGLGLLVEGFAYRPAFGLPYNLPYYGTLIEAAGFVGAGDIVSGYLSAAAPFPERIHRLSEAVQRRRGLRVMSFRHRRDLRVLTTRLRELYNAALVEGTGNVPLTEAEARTLASQLLWFADPRLIKLVVRTAADGREEPVGFLFAYPDISAAVQRRRGRLFPIGWLDMWLELRRTKWINVNGAAIMEQYRGLGGTAILFSEMHKSVVAGGYQHVDLVQIGVENDNMQRELGSLGVDFYKRHRLYARPL